MMSRVYVPQGLISISALSHIKIKIRCSETDNDETSHISHSRTYVLSMYSQQD